MSRRYDQHSALVHQRTDVRHRSTTLLLIKEHSDGCGITTSNLSPLKSRIARSGPTSLQIPAPAALGLPMRSDKVV